MMVDKTMNYCAHDCFYTGVQVDLGPQKKIRPTVQTIRGATIIAMEVFI